MARFVTIPIGPIFSSGPCRGIIHVVEKGDTLYKLGQQYHVSVSRIMYANPYVNIYNLQVGDELCIPVGIQPREEQSGRNMEQPMGMPGRMNMEQPTEMPGRMNMEQPTEMPGRMSMEQPMGMPGRMNMEQPMGMPGRMNMPENFSNEI